jgi:hypothetical protein
MQDVCHCNANGPSKQKKTKKIPIEVTTFTKRNYYYFISDYSL